MQSISVNDPVLAEVVYSPEMANTPDLPQRVTALEKQFDKADDKRDKIAEKLNLLISDRVVPTEARVNQIHGTAKWLIPTVIALFVGIAGSGGGIFYRLGKLDQRLDGQSSTILAIQDNAAKLSARIIVSGSDAEAAVQKTLASPLSSRADITGIAAVLDEAANKKVKIPSDAFKAAENNLRAAESISANESWNAILKLARYRSSLNEQYAPYTASAIPAKSTEFPNWEVEDAHWNGFVKLIGKVPYSESAHLDSIKSLMPQPSPDFGPEWAVVYPHKHNIELDGKDAKNVVFMGVTIEYDGGWVRLENVYFVNCTFKSRHSPLGEKFIFAVINSPRTSFSSS